MIPGYNPTARLCLIDRISFVQGTMAKASRPRIPVQVATLWAKCGERLSLFELYGAS